MIIRTDRLILRPFKKDDIHNVFEYCSNDKVGKMAGWKYHADIEETAKVMNEIFMNQDNVFAIEYNGKVIGSAGFIPDTMRQNDRCLMLGYALSENFWGREIMPETCKALIDYAFNILDLDLISATCYTDNHQSQRVLEKCNFKFEGILHNAEIMYDGEIKDKKCFYLTKLNIN